MARFDHGSWASPLLFRAVHEGAVRSGARGLVAYFTGVVAIMVVGGWFEEPRVMLGGFAVWSVVALAALPLARRRRARTHSPVACANCEEATWAATCPNCGTRRDATGAGATGTRA